MQRRVCYEDIFVWQIANILGGLNYKLVWPLTNPSSSINPWHPLQQQLYHCLSSLFSSKPNQTPKQAYLIFILGHPNQEPLDPLAYTAKRCMSLVGFTPPHSPVFVLYFIICKSGIIDWFLIMQDLVKHHQKQKQPKTSTIFSLTLQLGLSLHSLRLQTLKTTLTHPFC